MTLNELLNSDLSTITRIMRQGFDWWCDELAAMLPAHWMRRDGKPDGTYVMVDGETLRLMEKGRLSPTTLTDRGDVVILVRDTECLVRTLSLPKMARRDVVAMLALEGDRYFPMPAGTAVYAVSQAKSASTESQMRIDVAAMRLSTAEHVARTAQACAVRPSAICLVGEGGNPDKRFNFIDIFQHINLISKTSDARRKWWLLVGFLFALNVGMIAWRDSAQVDRLERLVEDQRPAVGVAHRIIAQMRRQNFVVARATAIRRNRDAVAILSDVTRAIPDGAWVQRYAFEGSTLRVSGYRAIDTDVASALRRVPRFASVKSAQTDEVAEIANGQPFDLVIDLKGR